MSTSALAQRTQEKLMERIKALRKLKDNRKCFECLSKSPSCVDTTHNTFVCMTCGGILRMFNFRVKSISISSFAVNEVEALESGGNKVARKKWLAGFDGEYPTSGNTEQIKEFVRKKYEEKAWVNRSGKSKRKSSSNKAEPVTTAAAQDQSDEDDSEVASSAADRRQSGSTRQSTNSQPDLLDLNAIFSSQSAPPTQASNFGASFSSQPTMPETSHTPQPFPNQMQSDWGAFSNSMFPNSYNQGRPVMAPMAPAQVAPSFPMDSFFNSATSGPAPAQYSMGAMPQSGFHSNQTTPFGMAPPPQQSQPALMSHYQGMGMPSQNMAMQQQQPYQTDSNPSRMLQFQQQQQAPAANAFSAAPSQTQQQPPSVPTAPSNADPFADLLNPQTMAAGLSSVPANRGALPSDDLFGSSNMGYGVQPAPPQQQAQRSSITSDATFGNSNVAFGGQQQAPKRNSIPSDHAFGNSGLEFGSADVFDATNPFGPPPPSTSTLAGFFNNQQPPNVNFGMEQPVANNRAFTNPGVNPSSAPSPFYSQPAPTFNQHVMPHSQQYPPQPIPMQQQQQQPPIGHMQGFPHAFASRPVEPFPFNNMPAQPGTPGFNMAQVPTANAAVPDFFSKQRPVDSLDSDLNSNPFLSIYCAAYVSLLTRSVQI